jgi:hypothetical protein
MGNTLHTAAHSPDSKHAHKLGASTQLKDSLTNQSTVAPTQGEHTPAPTSPKESNKPVRTADCSEHAHKLLQLPRITPFLPILLRAVVLPASKCLQALSLTSTSYLTLTVPEESSIVSYGHKHSTTYITYQTSQYSILNQSTQFTLHRSAFPELTTHFLHTLKNVSSTHIATGTTKFLASTLGSHATIAPWLSCPITTATTFQTNPRPSEPTPSPVQEKKSGSQHLKRSLMYY